MNRRKFLSVLSGAAAVAGGLGISRVAKPKPLSFKGVPIQFGTGKPYEKTIVLTTGDANVDLVELDWLSCHQPGFKLSAEKIRGYDPSARQYLGFDREGLFWTPKSVIAGNFDALGGLNGQA